MYVLPVLPDLQHGGVVLPPLDGVFEGGDVHIRICAAQLVKGDVHLLKIVVLGGHAAADDKRAVPPDDVGVDHAVAGVEGERVADIVHRQARHQGGALLALLHGIGGGHTHEHHLAPCRVGAHRHLLFPAVQGLQKGDRIGDLHLVAVEHHKIPVGGVESQVAEAAGLGAVDQVVHQLVGLGAAGIVGLHQRLHLAQAQVDGGGKVEGDLLAHAAHVDLTHLADGIHAPPVHVDRQKGENEDSQNGHQNQADRQKPGRPVF